MNSKKTVVVLGASNKKEKYSNKAVKLLIENNYNVIPVNPTLQKIEELDVAKTLAEISQKVWTLTLYLNPTRLLPMANDIISLNPERVIFNPGTESTHLQEKLSDAGIQYEEACTLIMLKTGLFE